MSLLFLIFLCIGGALGSTEISSKVPDQRVVIAKAIADVVKILRYHRQIPNPSKLAKVIRESDLEIFKDIESVFTDAIISYATHSRFPSSSHSDALLVERMKDVVTLLNSLNKAQHFQSTGHVALAAHHYALAIEQYTSKVSLDQLYPERPLWF